MSSSFGKHLIWYIINIIYVIAYLNTTLSIIRNRHGQTNKKGERKNFHDQLDQESSILLVQIEVKVQPVPYRSSNLRGNNLIGIERDQEPLKWRVVAFGGSGNVNVDQ